MTALELPSPAPASGGLVAATVITAEIALPLALRRTVKARPAQRRAQGARCTT